MLSLSRLVTASRRSTGMPPAMLAESWKMRRSPAYLNQWVPANKLTNGEHLKTANGTTATVIGGTVPVQHDGWMWDLTVPGNNDHDFYVVAGSEGAVPVLVHFRVAYLIAVISLAVLPSSVVTVVSWSGQGGGDVAVGGDAEVDGFGASCGGQVGLGDLLLAASRLTLSPSASPLHPSRSASVMRAWRLSRISSRRWRWEGSPTVTACAGVRFAYRR